MRDKVSTGSGQGRSGTVEAMTAPEARKVRATSPDGSVRITLVADGEPVVDIARALGHGRDEAMLAAQTRAALQAAVRAFHSLGRMRLGIVEDPSEAPETPRAALRRSFQTAVEQVSCSAESPLREVRIRWRGEDHVSVEVRPGAFARRTPVELTEDVKACVRSVLARFGREVSKAQEER